MEDVRPIGFVIPSLKCLESYRNLLSIHLSVLYTDSFVINLNMINVKDDNGFMVD